jgi:serine protease Do
LTNNTFSYLKTAWIALSVSMTVVVLYHFAFQRLPVNSDIQRKATAVAEREFVLSDRFINSLRSAAPTSFVNAAVKSRPAVVFIKSDVPPQTNASYAESSTGSGVIISDDGYIVTNHHVIKGANRIEILLNDNRTFNASIVGEDSETDIALLKIDTDQLAYLTFGNSDSLQVGEWVMAVGNPFRLQSTVTAGIVSAKARSISILENQGIESFIQTDAAINPGNSGGALINTFGDLIGICTAVLSNSGRYEGFSFAIPSNLVQKVISDLKTYGTVQRGWLGIDIENVTQSMATALRLDKVNGVHVSSVHKNGGAAQAGILAEDVIISVNQISTESVAEFMELIGRYRPGDNLDITLIRQGRKQKVYATLKNQLNTNDILAVKKDPLLASIGLEIREIGNVEKTKIGKDGVMVVSVMRGSVVGNTRMEPGYIISKVNNILIHSSSELLTILHDLKGKSVILQGEYLNYPGFYPYTFVVPNS